MAMTAVATLMMIGAMDRLEGFVAHHGADFYGLPRNRGTLVMERQDTPVAFPAKIDTGAGPVTVFNPGFDLHWRVVAG